MSFNLIDAAKGLFSNELVSRASAHLNESESTLSKAISGIIPAVLGGITEKATTSHEGAVAVSRLASEARNGGFLENHSGFFYSG